MKALLAGLAALLALAAAPATAHVTEIAVLSISQVASGPEGGAGGRYRLTWEMKPNTEKGADLEPILPEHCAREGVEIDCGAKGLVGEIGFEGIGAGQSAAMFKIRGADGAVQVYTVTPANPTAQVSPSFDAGSWEGRAQILVAYLQIGIEHILLGVDHLLFVLGLIWVATGRWMLLKTITAFTVAHSITLGAVTFGWVGVPEAFVNALIALSIVFIGVEVIHARQGRSTVTLRHPWAVSFGFGLLHGFGFANALVALGLPDQAIPLALLAFNIGVEIGQIAFVLAVIALGWAYREMRVGWPGWAQVAPAYAIGGLAAFWTIERVIVLVQS